MRKLTLMASLVHCTSVLLSPITVHHPSHVSNTSLGHIYALSRNASSDEFQFIDCDLTTWETSVSSLPPGVDIAGNAAAYAIKSKTFWSFTLDHAGERSIIGIDVVGKDLRYSINASAWSPPVFMISAIFVIAGSEDLVVIGVPTPGEAMTMYRVADPTGSGNTTHLGSLPCSGCEDWTWDPVGHVLYAVYNEDSSDGSSPSLVAISIANASAPAVVSNFTLPSDFEFPQWDARTGAVFGLELQQLSGPAGGYERNLTFIFSPADGFYNATSHGPISGGLYVTFDGKAFDPTTRRYDLF